MSAEAIALFLVGVAQPLVQEAVLRNKLSDAAASWLTLGVSAVLALASVYVTGGFAGGHVPVFSAADPSPLLGFLVAKVAPVYALSQVVFQTFKRQVKSVAGTA